MAAARRTSSKRTSASSRISGALGVKWAVVHPVEASGSDEISTEANIAYNHKIYEPVIRLASELGVGIAFENMADVDGHRRFGVTGEELAALEASLPTLSPPEKVAALQKAQQLTALINKLRAYKS